MGNLKQHFTEFFRFSDDSDALILERYATSQRQIPLMYVILSINMLSLCVTHAGKAPIWLTHYLPGILFAISIFRASFWFRPKSNTTSVAQVRKMLQRSLFVAIFLSTFYVGWSFALFSYGDAFTKGQVTFFIGVTLTTVITCLMPIRQVSIILFCVVVVPATIYLLMQSELVFRAIAVNMLLVFGTMVIVLARSNTHFRDSIEKKVQLDKANRHIKLIANQDSLTGLANRRHFFDVLEKCIKEAKPGETFSLVVLDLDGFKPINDVFGHPTGDRVLCTAAHRISEILSERGFLGRLGGDEFAMIISDRTLEEATEIVQDILLHLSQPINLTQGSAAVSATAGIAVFPDASYDAERLFERADFALCFAKQDSPGKAIIFTEEHERLIRSSSIIAQHLRDAHLATELSLVYQPIIEVSNGQIIGCEALARWNSPFLGIVPPDRFIPAAEQAGVMSHITRILLEKAIDEAADWPPNLRLGYNLSAVDICSFEATTQILDLLKEKGFDPHRLTFEITETAVMRDFDRAIQSLTRFKAAGIQIALDDFGTGNSSLGYLQKLPLDHVKIDRAFTSDLDENPVSCEIISTIISLCKSLKITCIIEGVETVAQCHRVFQLGGTKMQGYYFAKPLRPDQLKQFLESRQICGSKKRVGE